MLHSSLLGKSSNLWNTNRARQFLQIPEDQLEMIDSIPGWSSPENKISTEYTAESETRIEIVDDQLTFQVANSVKEVSLSKSSVQNNNFKDILDHSSSFLPKEKTKIYSAVEKQLFLKSVSLCARKVNFSSTLRVKRSTSVPDIFHLSEFSESLPSCKSESSLKDILCDMSSEHSLLKSRKSQVEKNPPLNKTYLIPSVLDDKTNSIKSTTDTHNLLCKAMESPVQLPKKKTFEKLESHIANHPFLKDVVPSTEVKFGGVPVFASTTASSENNTESLLRKKLKLLEKRFSPSKDADTPSRGGNLKIGSNLVITQSQKLPEEAISEFVVEVTASQTEDCSQSSVQNKDKTPLTNTLATVNEEKDDTLMAQIQVDDCPEKAAQQINQDFISVAQSSEVIHSKDQSSQDSHFKDQAVMKKTNVSGFEEESFLSQPIPCGQPLPSDVRSCSQSSLLSRSKKSPIKPQSVESTQKEVIPEKTNVAYSVFSENRSEEMKMQDSASEKVKSASKRKRKSKSEKTSKKLREAKSFTVDIKYTSAQVRNMIEIMKMCQFEP